MHSVITLIVLMASFRLNKSNRLHTAVGFIHKQLEFFENTITLFGTCDIEVTSFLDKKGPLSPLQMKLKESVAENLRVIKQRMNTLLQKKNSVVKNLLTVLYSDESGIEPDELQKTKQELVKQMTEVKEIAFHHMFNDSIKLGQVMDSNLGEKHVNTGLKILDPVKKDYDQSIVKLSEELGFVIDF